MRRLPRLGGGQDVLPELSAARGPCRIDPSGELARILLRYQSRERDLTEVRVAHPAGTIEIGAARDLQTQVQRHRVVALAARDAECLELIEREHHDHAARTRRSHRDDLVSIEGATHGLALHRGVRRQVRAADQPTMRAHLHVDRVGDPPGVERVGAGVSDRAQRATKLRELERIARQPLAASRLAVRRDRGGERREDLLHCPVELAGQGLRECEPLLRESHGGHHDIGPRQLAELPMRHREPAHGAGHAGSAPTRVGRRPGDLPLGVEVHRRCRLRGRLLSVIDRRRGAVGETDHHEAAPTDVPR